MDKKSTESSCEKSTYLYLDFNGKLSNDIFENEVFFKIANLNKLNPLVQVNDSVFKGSIDSSMGTNLFFEETENPYTSNVFEKQTGTSLNFILSSTKVLNLEQVKIPQAKANVQNEMTNINYNLNWDYKELLDKFEKGLLRIEDISANSQIPHEISQQDKEAEFENVQLEITRVPTFETVMESLDSVAVENVMQDITPSKILEAEYEQLNILARRPVKRAVSPEVVAECDRKYKDSYEYQNIERQILKPSDGFSREVLLVNENTLSECVDIDRCILYGLIPPSSNFPRNLSKQEKETLLSLDNFDNLSYAGRYYVLQSLVQDLGQYVKNAAPEELQEKDEYNRTPSQTLEILKKLSEVVRGRLREIKSSESSDTNI